MKKLMRFLGLLMLLVSFALPAAAAPKYVVDRAGLLKPQQAQELRQKLEEVNRKYQVRTFIVTVKSTGEMEAGKFANELLDQVKDKSNQGNMVMLLSMDKRKWYISTDNAMRAKITDEQGIKYLSNQIVPKLKKNNYHDAFLAFIEGTDKMLAYYQREGVPYDPSRGFNPMAAGIALVIAAVIGLLIRHVLIRQMNNVMPALEANAYLDKDSFQLEEKEDNYLYMTVKRVAKSKKSSSSGDSSRDDEHGGGGGGF
jgi:uncharacterized protein